MSDITVAQAFTDFLTEISASEYHIETLIPARKKSVIENLEETFTKDTDMPFSRAYLIGSAEKGTIIRPINDIDVLAVFSNENNAFDKYRYDSQSFLYRVTRAYDGYSTQEVGARGQAVRVFFKTGGYVDVAPVFWEDGDNYLLPAGDKSWLTTSPLKANKWFEEKNKELDYRLKHIVRLVKKWNREHSSYFNSFHLETMIAHTFTSLGTNYRDALVKFFDWAPNTISVYDPGGHSGDLSSYLTYSGRTNAIQSLNTAHTRSQKAYEAEEAGDYTEAKRLWSIVLGDDFPQ
ncbi:nucleotidyltransferase [Candidatus Roizmanbacteria bacterium]|nr:nucleotidyltransferase [Candidatus Roizmanbacteria bacterium]